MYKMGLLALTTVAGAAMGQAVSYSTPYTPGTPASVQASWSSTLDGTSPVFRRAAQSSSETAPIAPTTLAGAGNYPYHVQSFTPTVSGLYQFYSAQAYDGYLHLYQTTFDPSNALTNVLAGDDDMGTLNGGNVPNRSGVPGAADSGFQYTLTAGTTYHVVTSTYGAAVPTNGLFYNEIFGGGIAATPTYNIPDNTPAGVDIFLTIPASETRSILSLDSVSLTNFIHTWMGDVRVTLTHMDTGTTAVIMNQQGGTSNSTDLRGDYAIADGAAAWPTTGGATVAPAGTYGSASPLAIFNGEALAGTWKLNVSDLAGADLGSLSAFGLNATVPAPGAMALIALGGLVASRRRRA